MDNKLSFCLLILSIEIFFCVIISHKYHSVTIKSDLFKKVLSFINFALSFSIEVFPSHPLERRGGILDFSKFFLENSTIFSFKSLQYRFLNHIKSASIKIVHNQTNGSKILFSP
ncbi:MAG: hypothetical protein LBQ24_01695 [Candidatus Peribacteria bacterium]|nr:hypothetical protein [Candidatus Peribacteria bacterium]